MVEINGERAVLEWLGRKVSWGFRPGEWTTHRNLGAALIQEQLLSPGDHGIPPRPAAFTGISPETTERVPEAAIDAWISTATDSPRPLETFMELFWIDWFGLSMRGVQPPRQALGFFELLGEHALGHVPTLLRGVTTNPAMLTFLDGASNDADNPNENYARELLELYSLGVEHFDEHDVTAAARILTGWTVRDGTAVFDPSRNDPTPQQVLGHLIDSLDELIAVVFTHPATAERLLDALSVALLARPLPPSEREPALAELRQTWQIRPTVQRLLELAHDGHARKTMLAPIPWLVMAQRATGVVPFPDEAQKYFAASGQIPLMPPTVNGYPAARTWSSTSATVARFNMASHLAGRADPSLGTGRVADLADHLGLADKFSATTADALRGLHGRPRIAAALLAPETLVA